MSPTGLVNVRVGLDVCLAPAVILLAVDVPVSPVEGGVCLQLAVTQAAAQAGAVPHPPCSQ